MFNRIWTLYRKLSVVKIAELFGQIVLLLIIEPFYEIGWKPFDKIILFSILPKNELDICQILT